MNGIGIFLVHLDGGVVFKGKIVVDVRCPKHPRFKGYVSAIKGGCRWCTDLTGIVKKFNELKELLAQMEAELGPKGKHPE